MNKNDHSAMPKVLYFSSATHVQGGAVQSMFRNARWLNAENGEPCVVLPCEGEIIDWYEKEGVDVLIMPFVEMHRRKSPLYFIRYLLSTVCIILRLAALIKRRGIDVVHVNEITYWPGLIAGKIAGVSTICHVRVIIEEPGCLRWMLTEIVYQFSDHILCVSDAVRDQMFSSKDGKVKRLYNPGPDMDRFDPSLKDGSAIRYEFGIDPDAFVVGLVSKFSPNKGHVALIQAAHSIRDQGQDNRFMYLLVGGQVPAHESYYSHVHQMIDRYGLRDAFIFTGIRSDIPEVMAACDVLVHLPPHEDPLPNVVFEALAMAKPVIAFESGGIPEQFEDGKSGILLDKHDVHGLARALLTLSSDRDLRHTMGEEGRQFLVSNFSFGKFFSDLAEIYVNAALR